MPPPTPSSSCPSSSYVPLTSCSASSYLLAMFLSTPRMITPSSSYLLLLLLRPTCYILPPTSSSSSFLLPLTLPNSVYLLPTQPPTSDVLRPTYLHPPSSSTLPPSPPLVGEASPRRDPHDRHRSTADLICSPSRRSPTSSFCPVTRKFVSLFNGLSCRVWPQSGTSRSSSLRSVQHWPLTQLWRSLFRATQF